MGAKVRIVDRERRRSARPVGIDRVRLCISRFWIDHWTDGAGVVAAIDGVILRARRRQLLESLVACRRCEWLRIKLERKQRSESPIDSRGRRQRRLNNVREHVAAAVGGSRQTVVRSANELNRVVETVHIRRNCYKHRGARSYPDAWGEIFRVAVFLVRVVVGIQRVRQKPALIAVALGPTTPLRRLATLRT